MRRAECVCGPAGHVGRGCVWGHAREGHVRAVRKGGALCACVCVHVVVYVCVGVCVGGWVDE